MKKFRFRSGIGLVIALFVLNTGLVAAAVIGSSHLLIALAIVLSCAQFYLHDRFGRSYRTLTNYPFDQLLKDRLSFLPESVGRLFLKTRTNTELTEKECLLLARRSKSTDTTVVEDNLLPENDPGFEYVQTHPPFFYLPHWI